MLWNASVVTTTLKQKPNPSRVQWKKRISNWCSALMRQILVSPVRIRYQLSKTRIVSYLNEPVWISVLTEYRNCRSKWNRCQITKIKYRLRKPYMTWNPENLQKSTWRFLGWASSHSTKLVAGTSGWSVPISQSQTTVFVGSGWNEIHCPPAWIDALKWRKLLRRNWETARLEVLHLFRWFTHTHTYIHT